MSRNFRPPCAIELHLSRLHRTKCVKSRKEPRIRVFSKEELEAIVGAANNDQEQVLVAFMFDCGPKTSE